MNNTVKPREYGDSLTQLNHPARAGNLSFINCDFDSAVDYYKSAERIYGRGLFDANIIMCRKNFHESLDNVTAIIKTFERPHSLFKLLKSIDKFYPKLKIIIVDDSLLPIKNIDSDNVKYYWIGFDKGLSYGRNYALKKLETDYFILLDDDFVICEDTDFNAMLHTLCIGDLDILGGMVLEDGKYMNYYSDIEIQNGVMKQLHVENTNIYFTRCDVVLNFFIAKKNSVLGSGGWDDRLKLAEHTDFFYQAKLNGLRVAYADICTILHEPIREGDYKEYRARGRWFTELMMLKRGLKEIINVHGTSYLSKGLSKLELKQNSKLLYHNEAVADNHLKIVKKIGSDLGLNFFLSNGSLLGCIREDGYIGHDSDVDVGLFASEYKDEILTAFTSNGFNIFSLHGTPENGHEISLIKDNIKLDIFFYYPEPQSKLSMSVWKNEKQIKYIYNEFSLAKHTFRTFDFLIPSPAESYLQDQYGPDWRVPVKNWDWASSPSNLKLT